MIKENKIGKYLLYAIGEITLVVVGILIAVQIDDAVSANQKAKLETKILTEIQNSLKGDLDEIRDDLWGFNLIMMADSALIANYHLRAPFNDSLAGFVYLMEISPHFNPTYSAYKLLETKGIDIVSNDSLRIQITDFYERTITYYQKYENERFAMVEREFKHYNIKHFSLSPSPLFLQMKRTPFDLDALHRDQQWLSLIQTNARLAHVMMVKGEQLEKSIIGLISDIEKELNKSS